MVRKNKVVVPNDVFLEKFFEFVGADKSVEELADALSLSHQGCYQKLRKIRKELAQNDVTLPDMRVKSSKKTKISPETLVKIAKEKLSQTNEVV